MSPIKRLLRRVPLARWCAMQYAVKERTKRRDLRWNYVQTVLASVGQITMSWAGVEMLLDELIGFYQHGCTELEIDHPVSLSKKLDYMKTMQRDPRLTEEMQEFLRSARIHAKRIGSKRHAIIHGVLRHVGGTSTNWQIQRASYEGPKARRNHHLFHSDDLLSLGSDIAAFTHFLAPKIWVFIGGDPGKYTRSEVEEALRQMGGVEFTPFPPTALQK